MVTWSTKSPRSARSSSTSRYDSEKRKYQPTASRIISGSNWRHLNRPHTEEARRSIRPAYHGLPAKLQHFPHKRSPSGKDNTEIGLNPTGMLPPSSSHRHPVFPQLRNRAKPIV